MKANKKARLFATQVTGSNFLNNLLKVVSLLLGLSWFIVSNARKVPKNLILLDTPRSKKKKKNHIKNPLAHENTLK